MPKTPSPGLKIFLSKTLFLQLLLVILSFALMVVSSSFFVQGILKRHLSRQAGDILTNTKLKIDSELVEPQTALIIVSNTIRSMILRGDSADMVHDYMKNTGAEIQGKNNGFKFEGIYGYFEAFGNIFLHSEGWTGDEDYKPEDRPWYTTAIKAGDKIAQTPMYMNVRLNDYLITYVHRIFGNNGSPLGVVCLEVPLNNMKNDVIDMHIAEGGYGILLNENKELIAHPNPDFIGKNVSEVGGDFAAFIDGMEINYEKEIKNYLDQLIVAYIVRLDNNWSLVLMTPKGAYYSEMNNMMLTIIVLGIIFTAVLVIILVRIDIAKNKADEQNRQKTLRLAEMKKLREADERTQMMLDSMPFVAVCWNKKNEVVACNEATVRLFDLNTKQEFAERVLELLPEYQPNGRFSKEMVLERIKKAFDEGYCRFEWVSQKLDGEQIPCEITLVRVRFRNEYNVLLYLLDLRDLRAAFAKIKEADESTQVLFNASPLGCKLWSRDLTLIECNQEMLNLFDLQGKQEFFDRFIELSPVNQPDGRLSLKSAVEYLNRAFDEGFVRFEWMYQKLNGEPIPSEITLIRVKYRGNYAVAGYVRDLREYQRMMRKLETALREAQEANAIKSKFLATMSHEIRTPMNVILGVTESQLFLENLPQETKEAFEKIFDSGNLLIHIINDILDLSKIEAGKFELNPSNYELLSLINDAVNVSLIQFGHKQINFKLKVGENIPLHLYGDELRLKQILNNILSNAFKYTSFGEVELAFSVDSPVDEANRFFLVICVRDTGQGMTEEHIKKLFDEYSRFNLEANRSTAGTGLGMAITHNLVKLMEGEIFVDSVPGSGTKITVRIPQAASGSEVLGKKAADNLENFRLTKTTREKKLKIVRELMPYGKVLVVDDMKSNLDVAKLLLKPYDLQVDTADSGFEALDIIKNGKIYNIIFMDHMMPDMDGMETTKKIRGLGYKNPVIALTANAVTGQQEMFLANGFDGYISKPIDVRQLNDALNRFIRNKKRMERNARAEGDASAYADEESQFESSEENETSADEEIPDIDIPGIDVEAGLSLYGGDMDIYVPVLRSYIPNAQANIQEMRRLLSDAGQLQEMPPRYAVIANGLKGISANIGAENMRQASYELEKMAKAGDLAGVLAKNGVLLDMAETLVAGIIAWLGDYDSRHSKPLQKAPDRALLSKLRECCEAYDMKGIDTLMEELESASYEEGASLVARLKDEVNSSDFSAAAARLSEYMGDTNDE
jgi:signal transduction histidine kinase/DNA-binding NarL/FixJ family response regulator/HPt (histidine-containing phosphotransfer) domain-containing protein